jgi:hypothetical protein
VKSQRTGAFIEHKNTLRGDLDCSRTGHFDIGDLVPAATSQTGESCRTGVLAIVRSVLSGIPGVYVLYVCFGGEMVQDF